MKGCTSNEIAATVHQARASMISHLQTGRIYTYEILGLLFDDENRRKVISLLEKHGSFISGKPLPTPVQHSDTKTKTENLEEEEEEDNEDKSRAEPWASHQQSTSKVAREELNSLPFGRLLRNFEEAFPVTPSGNPPNKKQRGALAGRHDRKFYDVWRIKQQLLRKEITLKHFSWREPTEKHIHRFFKRMDWSKNVPDVPGIIRNWKPATTQEMDPTDAYMISLVQRQRWKGLGLVDDEKRGRKVSTKRTFQKGEAVCDFHGVVISAEEGLRKVDELKPKELRSLFFFHDSSGTRRCIFAPNSPCTCHSRMETPGRLIYESKKHYNVQPIVQTLDICGNNQYVILFVARHDIAVGVDLSYNYRLSTKSHRGEVPDWNE
ncbi:uncharacterized protein [Ambystoma mexicanum]|uniref:uncharacterized protein n=1 Tax=Ambystoma mexicanum TaxID=8296 RepID=UPI0037E7AEE9